MPETFTLHYLHQNKHITYRKIDDMQYEVSTTRNKYILAVNEDKDVVGVLSPKTDGKRTDLRTGAVADMSRFKGCAAVCVRLNSK